MLCFQSLSAFHSPALIPSERLGALIHVRQFGIVGIQHHLQRSVMLKIVKPSSRRKYALQHHHHAVCRLESSRNVGKLQSPPDSFRVHVAMRCSGYDVAVASDQAGMRRWLKVYPSVSSFFSGVLIRGSSTDCPKLSSINKPSEPGK